MDFMINHSFASATYSLLAHRNKMISDLWSICLGSRLHSSFDPNGQSRLVSPGQLHFSDSWAAKIILYSCEGYVKTYQDETYKKNKAGALPKQFFYQTAKFL